MSDERLSSESGVPTQGGAGPVEERVPPATAGEMPASRETPSLGEGKRAGRGGCGGRGYWLFGWGLSLACLVLRLINLMALPIFGDESIYLRWAQVIRGEGVAWGSSSLHLWVSLADPKPPLHFWLIALVFNGLSDPLVGARLISVAAGVVCVPAMMGVGRELGRMMVKREGEISGKGWGMVAAVLGVLCPFMAFYERLATADALFMAESLIIVWLSLRWARLAFEGGGWRSWMTAGLLGAAIGAALLTRQGVSYTICALPVVVWLTHASGEMDARAKRRRAGFEADQKAPDRSAPQALDGLPAAPAAASNANAHDPAKDSPTRQKDSRQVSLLRLWLRGVGQLAAAAVLAAAMWMPYLTAELHGWALALNHQVTDTPEVVVTKGELWAEVKRRIFYQASFTEAPDRVALTKRNAYATFVPGWNVEGNPNSGWLPLYMTPLVFAMCLVGLVYLAIRQRKVAFLLVVWMLLMLGPVVLLVENIFSRYVLAGVPPLLLAGAFLLGDTTALLWKKRAGDQTGDPAATQTPLSRGAQLLPHNWWGGVAAILLWGVILALPVLELRRQTFHWADQTLTFGGAVRSDRYQYLTGWTAGYGTRNAIKYLQDIARAHPEKPLVIVTTNGWGTPADAVWVYLSREPNVQLYFTDTQTILRPGQEKGTYRLKDDKWLFPPERNVRFAADAPVYFVAGEPVHAVVNKKEVEVSAGIFYKIENPNLSPPRTFYGIEGANGEGAAVFLVPRP